MSSIEITVVGGPTAIIEIGGVRLLTDPTFDEPGDYDLGGRVLTKTTPPALTPAGVGEIDAVLLSHDQHPDNLDAAGRRYLATAERVFSTASAAARIPGVTAVPTWTTVDVPRPDGRALHVTAVPAQHGPDGSEPIVGEVTGFVLTGDGTPTVYVSGDNASLAVVETIAARFPAIDVAVLFAGAAQTPLLGDAYLTLTSTDAARAVRILDADAVVPVHVGGWAHFTQGRASVADAFRAAGLADRLHVLEDGKSATFPGRGA